MFFSFGGLTLKWAIGFWRRKGNHSSFFKYNTRDGAMLSKSCWSMTDVPNISLDVDVFLDASKAVFYFLFSYATKIVHWM